MPELQDNKRKTLWIDRGYQLREINRIISIFMVLIGLQLACFVGVAWAKRQGYLTSEQAPVAYVVVAFAIPTLLCITYCLRTIRHTHRIAGAAYRIQQDLQNILCNPEFRFHLREGDYLQDLLAELNAVMDQLERRTKSLDDAAVLLEEVRRCAAQMHNNGETSALPKLADTLDALQARLQGARIAADKLSYSDIPESPQQSAQG